MIYYMKVISLGNIIGWYIILGKSAYIIIDHFTLCIYDNNWLDESNRLTPFLEYFLF